jgi:hypothetical protein
MHSVSMMQFPLDCLKQAQDNCNQAFGEAEPVPKLIQDKRRFTFACGPERRRLPQDCQGLGRALVQALPFPKRVAIVRMSDWGGQGPLRFAALKPYDSPNQTAL